MCVGVGGGGGGRQEKRGVEKEEASEVGKGAAGEVGPETAAEAKRLGGGQADARITAYGVRRGLPPLAERVGEGRVLLEEESGGGEGREGRR